MNHQQDNQNSCANCGKPIIESANIWHGHPVCDLCLSDLQSKQREAWGILKCQHCGKDIEPPESAKLWMKKIVCPVCDEKLHGPNSDPAERMADSLANMSHQLERNTSYLRFIAAILAIWLFLGLVGALVAAISIFSR